MIKQGFRVWSADANSPRFGGVLRKTCAGETNSADKVRRFRRKARLLKTRTWVERIPHVTRDTLANCIG